MWIAAFRVSHSLLLLAAALGACSGAGDPEAKPHADSPMVVSEVDAIVYHISRCWDFPQSDVASGSADAPAIEVGVKLNPDSSLSEAEIIDSERVAEDPNFRAWAESTLRAIEDCGFPKLPESKYEAWREIVLVFESQDFGSAEKQGFKGVEDPGLLTREEIEAVQEQFYPCWNIMAGPRDLDEMVVELKVSFDPKGVVQAVEILDKDKAARDPFFRGAAEAAARAVQRCGRAKMPLKSYAAWRQLTLVFDPRPFIGQ